MVHAAVCVVKCKDDDDDDDDEDASSKTACDLIVCLFFSVSRAKFSIFMEENTRNAD
jgi:hypothetical protein